MIKSCHTFLGLYTCVKLIPILQFTVIRGEKNKDAKKVERKEGKTVGKSLALNTVRD